MAKITTAMIKKAYEKAKQVYFGRENQTNAQDNLEDFSSFPRWNMGTRKKKIIKEKIYIILLKWCIFEYWS